MYLLINEILSGISAYKYLRTKIVFYLPTLPCKLGKNSDLTIKLRMC